MKSKFAEPHYFKLAYLNEGRFVDYYHTLRCALKEKADTFLEIGPGNGVVTWLLRKMGRKVITMDLCPEVEADIHGSVTQMPFDENEFDTVICCEVLEHLPWKDVQIALQEIHRVAKKNVVLSLPHALKCWYIIGNLPLFGKTWGSWTPPQKKRNYKNHPDHYWEIGCDEVSEKNFCQALEATGFIIKEKYRPGANKCHIFFRLECGLT